jgi:hypothetical protein
MPLGTQLCTLGLFYAPWGSSARPPLCVRALGYFKPLEAHICPLGAQLCPLGIKCVPLLKHAPPLMRVRPPYVCAPWTLLSPLRLIYVPLGHNYAPWDQVHASLGVRAPLSKSVPPLLGVRAPPAKYLHPSHHAYAPPPQACTPSQPGVRALSLPFVPSPAPSSPCRFA